MFNSFMFNNQNIAQNKEKVEEMCVPVSPVFTELAHWAYSVSKSQCPYVCVSVCATFCGF